MLENPPVMVVSFIFCLSTALNQRIFAESGENLQLLRIYKICRPTFVSGKLKIFGVIY